MSARYTCLLRHPQIQKLLELRSSVLVDNYFDYLVSLPVKMFGKGTEALPPYRTLLLDEAFARRAGVPSVVTHQSKPTEDGKPIRCGSPGRLCSASAANRTSLWVLSSLCHVVRNGKDVSKNTSISVGTEEARSFKKSMSICFKMPVSSSKKTWHVNCADGTSVIHHCL